MDVLEDFLHHINGCLRTPAKVQPEKLALALSVNPAINPFVVRINNLGNLNYDQVALAIERRNWNNGDWSAFETVVKSYVRLCNQMNPWSRLESFDLFSTYLNDISVAFSNKTRGHLLAPLFRDIVETIVPMAKQLDMQMLIIELHRKLRLTYVAAIILKGFNHIRSLLGANDHIEARKKSIMLFLGGKLCLIYFIISNPLLCQNVFSNMNNANLHISAFPKNEQMFYRYYLAKFYMVKYQFVDAYQHLTWCLHNLPSNYVKDQKNTTIILRDLIPLGIILGKRPNLQSFQQRYYSLAAHTPLFFSLYAQLLGAIKSGSFQRLHAILNDSANFQFLKQNSLQIIVASKSFVLTLRNLVRLVWRLGGRVNRLNYDQIAQALEFSLGGLDIASVTSQMATSFPVSSNNLIVENCLVTLIDQNLLRGKVFPRLRVASLAKTDVFPAVDKINFLKFGNGAEGTMAYADKWME
ncbi:hypothetical protein PUMCH_000753 [Australozyma saopauloensis]|uniref:PCI domain-containing protein n=1 Tax=Australozyma saopauloensis TaxID=291208 RepID=A0AAX4H4Z5_9ASCO|nr:hypothetical protein PUMCH_000753 [[Candida] saopauloensis]